MKNQSDQRKLLPEKCSVHLILLIPILISSRISLSIWGYHTNLTLQSSSIGIAKESVPYLQKRHISVLVRCGEKVWDCAEGWIQNKQQALYQLNKPIRIWNHGSYPLKWQLPNTITRLESQMLLNSTSAVLFTCLSCLYGHVPQPITRTIFTCASYLSHKSRAFICDCL